MHAENVHADLKHLSEGLLKSVGRSDPCGDILEVHHGAAPLLSPEYIHSSCHDFGVSVSLKMGRDPGFGQPVECDSSSLPFQDRVFSMVVLHHVISKGQESELHEAVRVLALDGVLVILGLNRLGWRYLSQSEQEELPGIAPLSVKSKLDQLEMSMQGFAGAGLLGKNRPVFMASGLAGLGSPLADVILLQARHNDGPEMIPLRYRKTNAGAVQSAPS